MSAPFLQVRDVTKSYFLNGKRIDVLRGVSVCIEQGELVSLIGASGSGKSTFLHVAGTLDAPAAGQLRFKGQSVFDMNDAQVAEFRNTKIGFVFQSHFLLPEFTAAENVAMPLLIRRTTREGALARAAEVLERVGLGHRLTHRPGELSGGERQRVAVARALVTAPACLLADEPTGNLDRIAADAVFGLLLALCREHGTALVLVTHDPDLASRADRVLHLKDGVLGGV